MKKKDNQKKTTPSARTLGKTPQGGGSMMREKERQKGDVALPDVAKADLEFLTMQVMSVVDRDSDDIPAVHRMERTTLEEVISFAVGQLPADYRTTVGTPLVAFLQSRSNEARVFWSFYKYPERISDDNTRAFVEVVLDVIQAVLQNGSPEAARLKRYTKAFQEVVSDLYAGFLDEENRKNVKPPDYQKLPALVKWGNKEAGPYTLSVEALQWVLPGIQTTIVSLPPGFSVSGIAAYTTLGHETTGHDLLNADKGLRDEIALKVQRAISTKWLADYWDMVLEETVSDVLGLLNFGPAAGIGLLAFFRGWMRGPLRNKAPATDVHPVDILRGYLAVEVLSRLDGHSKAWAKFIQQETDKDLKKQGGHIFFPGNKKIPYSHEHPTGQAVLVKKSLTSLAEVLMNGKMDSLEKLSLAEIRAWSTNDDELVEEFRKQLQTGKFTVDAGYKAAHAVAAAIFEGLFNGENQSLFDGMVELLRQMNDENPLFKGRAATGFRRPVYVPLPSADEEVSRARRPVSDEKKPPFYITSAEEIELREAALKLSPTPFYEPAASFDDFATRLFIPSIITVLYEKVKFLRFAPWEIAAIQRSLASGVLKKVLDKKAEEDDSHPPYIRVAITGRGNYDAWVTEECNLDLEECSDLDDPQGDYGQATILEIWPGGHYSPIHSHGQTTGILLGMAGVLDIVNFDRLDWNAKKLGMITLTPGQVCWLNQDSFAVHKVHCPMPKGQFGASFHVYLNKAELPVLNRLHAPESDSRDEFDYVHESKHDLQKFKTYSDLSWPVLRQELTRQKN